MVNGSSDKISLEFIVQVLRKLASIPQDDVVIRFLTHN